MSYQALRAERHLARAHTGRSCPPCLICGADGPAKYRMCPCAIAYLFEVLDLHCCQRERRGAAAGSIVVSRPYTVLTVPLAFCVPPVTFTPPTWAPTAECLRRRITPPKPVCIPLCNLQRLTQHHLA